MPVEIVDDSKYEQAKQAELAKKKEESKILARKVEDQVNEAHPSMAQRERKQKQIFKFMSKKGQQSPLKQIKEVLRAETDIIDMEAQRRDQIINQFDGDGEIHDIALKVLAYPAGDPLKRKFLESRLRNSKTINDYLRNKVLFRVAAYIGEDLRAILTYGYYVNESKVEVDSARILQGMSAPPQQRAQ